MMTGGDPIHAERKYGQPFTFTSFALPIFSANEPPLSSDQSQAWFDRWVIVPMEASIAPEARDPGLGDKLTQPSELEGPIQIGDDQARSRIVAGTRRSGSIPNRIAS